MTNSIKLSEIQDPSSRLTVLLFTGYDSNPQGQYGCWSSNIPSILQAVGLDSEQEG